MDGDARMDARMQFIACAVTADDAPPAAGCCSSQGPQAAP